MTSRTGLDLVLRRAVAAEYAAIGELTVAAYHADGFLVGDEGYAATLRDVAGRDREAEVYVAVEGSAEAVVPGESRAYEPDADGPGANGSGADGSGADGSGADGSGADESDADGSGAVLGAVTVCSADSSYAELARRGELEVRMLAVAPEARGRGVGARLMGQVVSLARARGMTRIVLCSQDRMRTAHRLYERFGFARLPARDWSIGEMRLLSFSLELTTD